MKRLVTRLALLEKVRRTEERISLRQQALALSDYENASMLCVRLRALLRQNKAALQPISSLHLKERAHIETRIETALADALTRESGLAGLLHTARQNALQASRRHDVAARAHLDSCLALTLETQDQESGIHRRRLAQHVHKFK